MPSAPATPRGSAPSPGGSPSAPPATQGQSRVKAPSTGNAPAAPESARGADDARPAPSGGGEPTAGGYGGSTPAGAHGGTGPGAPAARGGRRRAGGAASPRDRVTQRERRLRRTVRRYASCLGGLAPRHRLVLRLRAGLDGPPASRRKTARRLDLPASKVRRLERTGLRELREDGCAGATGGSGEVAIVSGGAAGSGGGAETADLPLGAAAGTSTGASAGGSSGSKPARGAVLGDSERAADSPESSNLVVRIAAQAGWEWMILLALLGLLAAGYLSAPWLGAARARRRGVRNLEAAPAVRVAPSTSPAPAQRSPEPPPRSPRTPPATRSRRSTTASGGSSRRPS